MQAGDVVRSRLTGDLMTVYKVAGGGVYLQGSHGLHDVVSAASFAERYEPSGVEWDGGE